MIIILLIVLALLLLILAFIKISNPSPSRLILKKIYMLTKKNLDLDGCTKLIELSRQLTMIQVKDVHSLPPKLKEMVNDLLGLVLQIPRLEDENISKALQQIEIIQKTSLDIQDFFNKNQKILYTYIK